MRLLHRTRVTLVTTIVSAVALAIVLIITSLLLQSSSDQTARIQLRGPSHFFARFLEFHHGRDPAIEALVKRSRKDSKISFVLYGLNGQLVGASGHISFPKQLKDFTLPSVDRYKKIKLQNGSTLVVAIDWSDRVAELGKTNLALLALWPALTALIGLTTFLSISSSFKPFYRLLHQAKSLKIEDRLHVDDQAEFGELAESINAYLDTIQRVVKQQEEFAVDAAHELFTPLTALRGNLEVALRSGDLEKLKTASKAAIDQVTRLERLTSSLLISTRPKGGRQIHCNAQEVVERAQARWVDRYAEKSVTLDADTNFYEASMAEEEIDCVVDNILSNALRYAPKGTHVSIKLSPSGTLVMQDQGPGIPPEIREKVFERFERGTAIGRGHGIGLYLVKRLIEDSHGTIAIADSDTGAKIVIDLPRFVA